MGYAEYRIIRPDSGELRWIARRGEVVREQGQTAPRYVGVIWDITERMAVEDRLRQLNETLEQRVDEVLAERKLWAEVFEHTDAFICVLDRGYNWLAVNRAYADEFERIYGVRPKAGDNMLALLRHMPEHRKDVRAVWDRALAGEEFTLVSSFGDAARARVPYELTYKVLHDREGRMIGAYQFAQNIAERVKPQPVRSEAGASAA
jgi:PAS domain S-box-containing protein